VSNKVDSDRVDEVCAAEAARWLTPDEQAAWVALTGVLVKLPTALDAQLLRDSELNTFEYFVLSGLSHEPDRTLRMSELAVFTNGSLSRLSHVVKRLEARGWVRREPSPENGRHVHAILTDAGWDKVVTAAPGHVEAVRRFVFDALTAEQVQQLGEIGRAIQTHIDPDGAPHPLGGSCTAPVC
jgi:DNA-binding MarR family transcriptional regulator